MNEPVDVSFRVDFEKSANPEGSYVRGWASVVIDNGAPVVDWQGDVVPIAEITKAAHQFITDERVGKVMHKGKQLGDVVESVIVDDDFCKALGATTTKRGWWIGMQIHDAEIRKRVVSGELRAFSIGGSGVRTPGINV